MAPITPRTSVVSLPVGSDAATVASGSDGLMGDRIRRLLERVEAQEGVRVLYAVESGSRAWGFASPDSDYDVRFVFVRPVDAYLLLEALPATITVPCAAAGSVDDGDAGDAAIDVEGWDVRKFLQLMRKSNPSVFEWLGSTAIYAEAPSFERVRSVAQNCFSPHSIAHHYMSMAYQNGRELRSDSPVRLKKYLYVVRALLAARWVIQNKSPVPVPFAQLENAVLEPEMRPTVDAMVAEKKINPSGLRQPTRMRVAELDAWIAHVTDELAGKIGRLPKDGAPDWSPLDAAFKGVLLEDNCGDATFEGVVR